MEYVLIIILCIFLVSLIISNINDRKKSKQKEKEANEEVNLWYRNLKEKYGKPSTIVEAKLLLTSFYPSINDYIIVFEEQKKICLLGDIYNFSEITGYKIVSHKNKTIIAESKVSTGDMVKRAVAGGVLLGGVGAIIGASTAKRKESKDDGFDNVYDVTVFMNSIKKPAISISPIYEKPEDIAKIEGIFRIITS